MPLDYRPYLHRAQLAFLDHDLAIDDHQIGLETMCVAGGQGEAMLVERLN